MSRRLSRTQRAYVLAYRRAYHRAGIEYRQELALLADAHRQELTILADAHRQQMAHLAAVYDRELASLSADFAALAREHHSDQHRRAIAAAEAERSANPLQLLH